MTCTGVAISGLTICNWLMGPTTDTASQEFGDVVIPVSGITVLIFSDGKAASKWESAPRVLEVVAKGVVSKGSRFSKGTGPGADEGDFVGMGRVGLGVGDLRGVIIGESAAPPAVSIASDSNPRLLIRCRLFWASWFTSNLFLVIDAQILGLDNSSPTWMLADCG